MSHLRVCLFALLVLAVGFTVSTDDVCNKDIAHGSEGTIMGKLEKTLQTGEKIGDKIGSWKDSIWNSMPSWPFKKPKQATYGAMLNEHQTYISKIAPGTKWCGDGNIAKNEDDLGFNTDVDKCCREHDNCKQCVSAGDTLLNLLNDATFTRSHCTCDNDFHKCLKDVKGYGSKIIAASIGKMYFNTLSPQCFQCSCPMEKCDANDTNCVNGCTKYEWVNCKSY